MRSAWDNDAPRGSLSGRWRACTSSAAAWAAGFAVHLSVVLSLALPARATPATHESDDEYVKTARYPAQFAATSFVKPFGSVSTRPMVDYHHAARLVGAVPVTARLAVGASVLWFHSRAAWAPGEDPSGLQALLGGPLISYTQKRWCLNAVAMVGAAGERWSRQTFGALPLVSACWAWSPNGLLSVGAAGFAGRYGVRFYPVLGGSYKSGVHDLRVLLPFFARYTHWVSDGFGVGASLLGNTTPYVTPGNALGDQLGMTFPVFGASAAVRLFAGVSANLVVGAALTPWVVNERGEGYGGKRFVPASSVTLEFDQRLLE